MTAGVDLYWIPLGAGGRCVWLNGRVFEALAAARERRPRCDLYHAALVASVDGERYAIELAPSPDGDLASRGVVATGPVGSRSLGRLRLFRYELRCWRGGAIPDLGYAVGGPVRLTSDPARVCRLLELAASVPTPVWGRDELCAGEMWNSNSVIAWLIAAAGLDAEALALPVGGRAPGWSAGLARARHGAARIPPSTCAPAGPMTTSAGTDARAARALGEATGRRRRRSPSRPGASRRPRRRRRARSPSSRARRPERWRRAPPRSSRPRSPRRRTAPASRAGSRP